MGSQVLNDTDSKDRVDAQAYPRLRGLGMQSFKFCSAPAHLKC